ncbi:divalent-cation tolerance protein CutA [Sphingomonas sp. BN140010]|uniref:Divalent-cation tolerance protein CutA n=1 Tax=Sphingomonas arvum TaxID=2992113 RepID=A0ABT3JIJ9_9SPHN|nr:divalent-cation tolerance protein CutA [Sphingomonas sp. BN140010]MCW3798869.1 divalent-cation tolerance protein CutA [Sphingomonas sp. BN140010]
MSIVSIYCVFGSAEEAERVGRQVVEERLAACINILGSCKSIYRWHGAIEQAEEVPAILKTDKDDAERLISRLAELHSYEVPAIVAWPIEAVHPPYADWVRATVSA